MKSILKYKKCLFWKSQSSIGAGYLPSVAYGCVFLGASCYNPTTGALKWQDNLSPEDSPAVANGLVYVGSGSSLYCLNATNGNNLWSKSLAGIVYSSLALTSNYVYAASSSPAMVYCFNAITGVAVWNYSIKGDTITSSSLAIANGRVYITTDGGTIYCFGSIGSTQALPIYSQPIFLVRVYDLH